MRVPRLDYGLVGCERCGGVAGPKYRGAFPYCERCQHFVKVSPLPLVIAPAGEALPDGCYTWEELKTYGIRGCGVCGAYRQLSDLDEHVIRERPRPWEAEEVMEQQLLLFTPEVNRPSPEEEEDARFFGRWYSCRGGCRP